MPPTRVVLKGYYLWWLLGYPQNGSAERVAYNVISDIIIIIT
jgi:hypothetical protein